jgi:hypothetical protein
MIRARFMFLLLSVPLFGCTTVVTSTQVLSQKDAIPAQSQFLKTSGYYSLPRGKFRLSIQRSAKGGPCTAELKETVYEPDPRYLFRLDYHRSITSADKFNVEVGENDLLKTVLVETDDRSVAIAQKLVEIAKESAKASVAMSGMGVLDTGNTEDSELFSFDILLLPPETQSDVMFLEDLNRVLKVKMCPQVQIDPPFPSLTTEASINLTANGLFFRPLMPYDLRFVALTKEVLWRKTVYLPNASPVLLLDLSRAFLVKKTTAIQFQNGFMTTLKGDTPSSLEAFMDIPLSIAKAAASLPAELIQLKLDLTQKDTAVLNAQKDQIEAQKNTINATKELIKADEELRNLKAKPVEKPKGGNE